MSSGTNRDHEGTRKEDTRKPAGPVSPFMPMFEQFRDELDEHHDRRERIIKVSRDVTALSKKIIFSLQRVRTLNAPLPKLIAAETDERRSQILHLLRTVAPDLQGINAWRYQRQISPGIQELVEAVTLTHYLARQTLVPPWEAAGLLAGLEALPPVPKKPDSKPELQPEPKSGPQPEPEPEPKPEPELEPQRALYDVLLTDDDYVLGVFDLVGEMMRFAITTMATTGAVPGAGTGSTAMPTSNNDIEAVGVGTGGRQDESRSMLQDMRALRAALEALDTSACRGQSGLGRDVEKKLEVMRTCVEKVEMAVYGMTVRGSERPAGWMPDVASHQEGERAAMESY